MMSTWLFLLGSDISEDGRHGRRSHEQRVAPREFAILDAAAPHERVVEAPREQEVEQGERGTQHRLVLLPLEQLRVGRHDGVVVGVLCIVNGMGR